MKSTCADIIDTYWVVSMPTLFEGAMCLAGYFVTLVDAEHFLARYIFKDGGGRVCKAF